MLPKQSEVAFGRVLAIQQVYIIWNKMSGMEYIALAECDRSFDAVQKNWRMQIMTLEPARATSMSSWNIAYTHSI